MTEEIIHLNDIITTYNEVIEDSILKLSNIKEIYKHDYDKMLDEKFKLEHNIERLKIAKKQPYFARIDFENKNTFDKCYIGKTGVIDFDNNVITVDWRAPIASLYYDSNIGKCSYNAPEGLIEGNLLLKRQYTIENSKLINFNDVDTVSNDELLKPYLGVSADNRLKNIVATIQSEQNKIIREKMNKNLVIQGVAGSGKTTVALHRIAYLAYNYRDIYKPSDYMVIGPNKFFVSYISSILPDLDVNGVTQNTLEDLFKSYVNENYIVNNSLDTIMLENKYAKEKSSLRMQKIIDEYFYNIKVIPDNDFTINNIKIISKEVIKNIYSDINKDIFISIKQQIERMILLLNKYITDNIDIIINKLIINNVDKSIINEVKTNINTHLKKYFSVLNIKPKNIYIEILNELDYPINNIKNNYINVEDIAPILYINYKLYGSKSFDNYKHIVIDEAQDYGVFTFYVLNKLFKNATFSIYGDLAQSLYPYRSLDTWESLSDIFKNFEILKLRKSYRTTIEIMNFANKINELVGLEMAEPVIRHGDIVEYSIDTPLELINKLKNKYNSIALITKDLDNAKNIYNDLKDKTDIKLITPDDLSCYNSCVSIMPSYLSKGLEFDAVVVLEESLFDKNNVLDMKLLYVSETRALHKLIICK